MSFAPCKTVADVLAVIQQQGLQVGNAALCVDHRRLQGQSSLAGIWLVLPGQRFDPRTVLAEVLEQGQCALAVVDFDATWCVHNPALAQHPRVVLVQNLVAMQAKLAAAFYQTASVVHPNGLRVVAVTGTNGKTSICRWLAQTLNALGVRAAVMGTLGHGAPDALRTGLGLTTPSVVDVHRIVHELHSEGFGVLCLEASSIGLVQGRLQGLPIDIAVFSNLTQDHLDVHGTMQAYGQAKLLLAQWPGLRCAVAYQDASGFGQTFASEAKAHGAQVVTVGTGAKADVQRTVLGYTSTGLQLEVKSKVGLMQFQAGVLGDFNADNLALVAAVLRLAWPQPFAAEALVSALSQVSPPPGRMQWVCQQPAVVVDYAHTPDALQRTLQALRSLARARQGRLGVLFGCGGNRDRSKRPLMGEVAAHHADALVLTSDNPRSENPAEIVSDICRGLPTSWPGSVHVELDRKSAIAWAIQGLHVNDVLLLAGKGHEQTQEYNGVLEGHCDVAEARLCLQQQGVVCQI